MNLNALLDKIAGRQQDRQKAREADFRKLVVRIADGHEPDADVIDAIFVDTGRTIEDLRQSVELLQRRREMRRQVDDIPKLAAEVLDIEAKVKEASRIFDEARKKHDDIVDPLEYRIKQVRKLISEGEQARRDLVSTCTDEKLVKELAEITKPLSECEREVAKKETQLANLRRNASYQRDQAKHAQREPNAEAHKEEAEKLEEEAKALERELPRLTEVRHRLRVRDRKLREQMLEP